MRGVSKHRWPYFEHKNYTTGRVTAIAVAPWGDIYYVG
jgi:hypothetical protein